MGGIGYAIFKLIHVALAVLSFGATATFLYWLRRADGETADPREILFVSQGIRSLSRTATWLYTALLVTGIGLVHMAHLRLMEPWILASLLLLVGVLGCLGALSAVLKKQIAAADNAPEVKRVNAKVFRLAAMAVLLGFASLCLMVIKPSF